MTHQEFCTKYLGRYVDYDGRFGNQCVDLMRQYIKEVYGIDAYKAVPAGATAKQIFNNFKSNKYFKKIINNPNDLGHPIKGDLVFYKEYPFLYGTAGHVEVVDQADGYYMVNFSQNWKTGSSCRFVKRGSSKLFHGYRGCLGWLRKI